MFVTAKLKLKRIAYQNKFFWQGISKTIFLEIVCFGFFFFLEKNLNLPKFNLSQNLIFTISGILILFFLLISIFSFREISPSNSFRLKLKNKGLYSLIRHPFYAGIVFCLNPAIAILFKSFGLLFASIACYFIWKDKAEKEEELMIKRIGKVYKIYQLKVPRKFFPSVFEISYSQKKPIFYFLAFVLSVFLVVGSFNLYLNIASKKINSSAGEVSSNISETTENTETTELVYDDILMQRQISLPSTPLSNSTSQPQVEINNNNITETNIQNTGITSEGINKNLAGSISIPKINIQAPIIFVEDVKWVDYDHKYGVVHYPATVLPGEKGAVLLSGHSSAPPNIKSQYNYVFSKLNNLEVGDNIAISFQGNNYLYQVFKKEIVLPQNFKLREYQDTETVTLLSCWPVGTAARRIVIEAQRVK